jgi:ACT domain-containing protein
MLHKLFTILTQAGIDVKYMYALSTDKNGSMVIKVSEPEKAVTALKENDFELIKAEEAYIIND